jgi:alkanesulfonate monooxygenase SsuD/methylene tetrahydromethanopterin reductase-like flavin-dependent oxidoreductase (luciferase family)
MSSVTRNERSPLRFGLFLQSSHPPGRALGDAIERVLTQIQWADELGFSEAWLGEHLTAVWEPIPAQDLVIAQALTRTQDITLCAGAYVLPFYHPAALAMRISQLDHMAKGRFICGIAAGSVPTDLRMLDINAEAGQHREMMEESLEIIQRIWAEPLEPWTIEGKYWTVHNPEPLLGFGPHLRPYQTPHPPIALAGLSPDSPTLESAGAHGFLPLSLTFNTPYLKGHWTAVERGAGRAWRDHNFPTLDLFGWRQFLKHDETISDDDVDLDYLIDHLFLVGSPETVAARLVEVDAELGGFGTVVLNAYDWGDEPGPYRRSMELFAREVMPRVEAARSR